MAKHLFRGLGIYSCSANILIKITTEKFKTLTLLKSVSTEDDF